MLLEQPTKDAYNYDPLQLSNGSGKKIKVKCDYCGVVYDTTPKSRTKAHTIIAKDACKKCKYVKMADINMIKYGVKNVSQLSAVKDKIRDANKERLQSAEFKEQARQTNLDKYGCEHAMQNEDVKEHQRQVFRDRYGVDNPSELEEVKQKRMATCKGRFGTEHASQSDEGKQRIRDGFQAKFGADNAFQNEDVKAKIRATLLQRLGVTHHMKVPEVAHSAVQKGLLTRIANGDVKLYENKTYPTIADDIGFSRSHFYTLVKKHGIEVAITLTPQESSLEVMMRTWLEALGISFQKQFRVNRKIADFYIPARQLIIECDGLYWHSDAILTDSNYHVNKRKLYLQHKYTPLFFREDELNHKFDIVKSIISNKLGMATKLNARACKIEEVDSVASKEFLQINHLMGNGRGQSYVLTLNGDIVCLMRICKRSEGAYEISRFSPALNCSVRGGFSRLMKYAISQLPLKSLTTFIDLRYGSGAYLTNFGFQYDGEHPSFRWTNGKDSFHRMQFPSQTGYDKGLVKIWDCGQAKYVLNA